MTVFSHICSRAQFCIKKGWHTCSSTHCAALHCIAYTPLMASVEYEPTRMQSNSLDFAFDSRRKWEKNKTDMKIKPKQQKQQQQQQQNVMWARKKNELNFVARLNCVRLRTLNIFIFMCVCERVWFVCVCVYHICNIAFNIESRRTWHWP